MLFQQNISLKNLHTFGVEAKAKLFCEISSEDELLELIQSPEFKENKWLILGEGSDVLFSQDFNGLIMKDNIKGIDQVYETDDFAFVKASSGENWHAFVEYCVNQNWGGIESLALIPGNVGASPLQNIGAYGAEVKDTIHSVEVFNFQTHEIEIILNKECGFSYRWSIFKEEQNKNKYFITSVTFRLAKTPVVNINYKDVKEETGKANPSIADVFHAVMAIRTRKLPSPKELGNAGSFFKNPHTSKTHYYELQKVYPDLKGFEEKDSIKLAAAQLIDLCGWKGKVEKGVGVYQQQALVICNYGNAKGSDVIGFAKKIQKSVKEKFGIDLIPEVNIY
ncbi:MAG: UDP-N-acetylmuramate dehydrogenase [Bacteroidetes bacterium]|nr:UDP-N-acetylmuramate dehydrogenase [Bacteroidota bacterium]MBL6962231.1 UDP-N-acetylmuramate dehydrogenase [Bacteroidota bacterium]